MPRPGPRPYECVRRAWHSERHHPMRGSLIGEIFRLVNENHSPATRTNKEWQDKLPIVVLKAEEIMYSKANSEAEYMEVETLWDRANDAINTIIRLDDTTETGVFLQPCIEAALNLGCTPMRTSRSQRNNASTYYLNAKYPDSNFCPSSNFHKTIQETPMTMTPFVPHYSQIMTHRSINLPRYNLKPQIPVLPNDKSLRNNFCFPSPSSTKPPSVYPLYYGNAIALKDPKINYGAPPSELYSELKENSEMGFIQKPYFLNPMSKNEATQVDLGYTNEEQCDLSLRLGPSTVKTTDKPQPHDMGNFDDSRKWNPESEAMHMEAGMRKRKAVYDNLQFCWRSKVSSANSNAGL